MCELCLVCLGWLVVFKLKSKVVLSRSREFFPPKNIFMKAESCFPEKTGTENLVFKELSEQKILTTSLKYYSNVFP